jgi:hypothetical protein
MVAYFSSKLPKQIQAALAVALLMVCMMGTHWIGFAHSVSHASFQQHGISQSSAVESTPSYTHNSDVCHLFDALTLASFMSGEANGSSTLDAASFIPDLSPVFSTAQADPSVYQSRAPPAFLL